jgi:hypothetical protein
MSGGLDSSDLSRVAALFYRKRGLRFWWRRVTKCCWRRLPGAADPVQAHCARETPMFAADMERRALKRIYVR